MLASLVHARHAEHPVSLPPPGPAPRRVPAVSPHPAMALEPEALLDLSFLTEEERSCIAEVLRRDWQLRRREEGRIRWAGGPCSASPLGTASLGPITPWGQSSQAQGPLFAWRWGRPWSSARVKPLVCHTSTEGPKPPGRGWLVSPRPCWGGSMDWEGSGATTQGSQCHPPAPSKLRKSVSDPARLRSLTGDWFCDARAQRHRHPLGSDLVRASIRRRRRPRGRRGMGCGGTGKWGLGLGPLSSPMSPGMGDLERGPSLGELEAIDEPLAEEKEDEDGALDTEER